MTPQEQERRVRTAQLLAELHAPLRQLKENLEDLNSSFPETKKFLEARGLSHVRQLSDKGKEELARHLSDVLLKENPMLFS